MASSSNLLLTSTNYFSWKSHMEDSLRSKGSYWITLGKEQEQEPIDDENKVKWDNINDETRGLIKISISNDLRFHLQRINALDEASEKLEAVFGKHNIVQAHQFKNQLTTLSPNDFTCIEDYLSRFKTLILLFIECNLDVKEYRCIYVIFAKLGNAYYVFVSTFYTTKETLMSAYKRPSLESFCDALIREQDNLVQLGLISTTVTSKKSLVVQQKDKSKNIKKQHPHHNNKQNKGLKPSPSTFAPNGDK
jgi:hypothetical protein